MILSTTYNEKNGQLTIVAQLGDMVPSSTGKMLLAGTTGGWKTTTVQTDEGPLKLNLMIGVTAPAGTVGSAPQTVTHNLTQAETSGAALSAPPARSRPLSTKR